MNEAFSLRCTPFLSFNGSLWVFLPVAAVRHVLNNGLIIIGNPLGGARKVQDSITGTMVICLTHNCLLRWSDSLPDSSKGNAMLTSQSTYRQSLVHICRLSVLRTVCYHYKGPGETGLCNMWINQHSWIWFDIRFQSITKQYFRRVDGILVMYDITAECSFVAVRNWMTCVQVRKNWGYKCWSLGRHTHTHTFSI